MSDTELLLVAGVPLLVLWVMALVEVSLRSDLSRLRRAAWVVGLVVVPVVGLAAYALVRPLGGRSLRRLVDRDAAGSAEATVRAVEGWVAGDLDDDAYRAALDR